jgi:hypothetical protein
LRKLTRLVFAQAKSLIFLGTRFFLDEYRPVLPVNVTSPFDARHNVPRIGRVLMATGRDATDVAISTSFGPSSLATFFVTTDEVHDASQ